MNKKIIIKLIITLFVVLSISINSASSTKICKYVSNSNRICFGTRPDSCSSPPQVIDQLNLTDGLYRLFVQDDGFGIDVDNDTKLAETEISIQRENGRTCSIHLRNQLAFVDHLFYDVCEKSAKGKNFNDTNLKMAVYSPNRYTNFECKNGQDSSTDTIEDLTTQYVENLKTWCVRSRPFCCIQLTKSTRVIQINHPILRYSLTVAIVLDNKIDEEIYVKEIVVVKPESFLENSNGLCGSAANANRLDIMTPNRTKLCQYDLTSNTCTQDLLNRFVSAWK
jgi:hypothetical protein